MKKYPIFFTTDYSNKDLNDLNNRQRLTPEYIKQVELCRKWSGKLVTILEMENLIGEFKEVVFDGEHIEVYNDYRE